MTPWNVVNVRYKLSAQVAQAVTALTSEQELYQWLVTKINEQFGFYHTQLWRYHPISMN